MFGGDLASRADGVSPFKFDVWPIAKTNLLFEQSNQLPRLARVNQACAFNLTETVEYLDTLPGCSDDLSVRFTVEECDGRSVMNVAPTFVSKPPGGIRVNPHFLSDRRKAVPSNFGALGSPTALCRASRFVIWRWRGLRDRSLVSLSDASDTVFIC
jgi:hypothetical protein